VLPISEGADMTDKEIIFAALIVQLQENVAKQYEIARLKMKYGVRK
jgi:hypothetical protein